MIYWFTCLTVWIFAKIFFRLRVKGLKNIPKQGAFIIASNHRSYLDPPFIGVATYRSLYFMAKAELFKNKFFGRFLKAIHCIDLNRKGADKGALKEGLKILKKGAGLVVFPEGMRSLNGTLGPAKMGVALFALGANVPVVPAFVEGSSCSMSPSYPAMRFVPITITFGKPIYPGPINRQDKKRSYQEFTDKVMQEIKRLGEDAL